MSGWVGGCGKAGRRGGGVASIPPLVGEKCSAAEMNSKVGGKREKERETPGFHDYQVL